MERITLGEGGTPLVPSQRIGAALGLRSLWFKYEGANPTGSYKDRFAAAAVSRLQQDGRKLCLGTSSGNTGAALAAYCARAGIACCLVIVEGAPESKLRQMRAYGATLFRLKGFGACPATTADVMESLRKFATELNAGLEISAFAYSPAGMAGVQTISYELAESFRGEPFNVFSPAGGGGLTLAVVLGLERVAARARVHCVQPMGNDTIASALRTGKARAAPVESTTAISGLQVGNVLDGDRVIHACRRSGGQGYVVDDEQVWVWQSRLAREEGIFCEPAGAVAIAGVEQALTRGELSAHEHVVCLVTGSGFKDEHALSRLAGVEGTPLLNEFAEFAHFVREME